VLLRQAKSVAIKDIAHQIVYLTRVAVRLKRHAETKKSIPSSTSEEKTSMLRLGSELDVDAGRPN